MKTHIHHNNRKYTSRIIRWRGSKKTFEGSLAFLCIGMAIIFAFPEIKYAEGAIAVLVVTLVEIPEKPLNDNSCADSICLCAIFP